MKTVFKLSVGLLVMSVLFISGCSKDSPTPDPADAFVGSYTYSITASALGGTRNGNLTITKTAPNKISILTSGGNPTPNTVSGNNFTEDANQTVTIPVSSTSTAVFTETSTGTKSGKNITINGTWSNPLHPTLTFKVIATKQ